MKTFLRENKLRFTLLGIPVLCLIILWSGGIYKIWWDLTPWKNLGSPPKGNMIKFGQIGFSNFYSPDSNLLHFIPYNNFQAPTPSAYIYNQNSIYIIDDAGVWTSVEVTKNPTLEPYIIKDERECAASLKTKWRLFEDNSSDGRLVDERGYCLSGYFQYAVYRMDDRGNIWIKYLNSKYPEHFRSRVTHLICLSIFFFVPPQALRFLNTNLNKLLRSSDFLDLKPDYDAK